jgi:DNA-binding CsgD family transcriptional regulator
VTLTDREREVLTWVADGKTAWEIGEVLEISHRTVEWYIQQAAQKLGARNRIQAVVIAARDGLIEI